MARAERRARPFGGGGSFGADRLTDRPHELRSLGATCLSVCLSGVAGQPYFTGEELRYWPSTELCVYLSTCSPTVVCIWTEEAHSSAEKEPKKLGQISIPQRREPGGQPNSSKAFVSRHLLQDLGRRELERGSC